MKDDPPSRPRLGYHHQHLMYTPDKPLDKPIKSGRPPRAYTAYVFTATSYENTVVDVLRATNVLPTVYNRGNAQLSV